MSAKLHNVRLLFRDELLGFAKSSVMIGLWVGLPLLAVLTFYIAPDLNELQKFMPGMKMPMTTFVGILVSSIGSLLASIMLTVDLVHERHRRVYDLFVIRPIAPGAILWAKFFAVLLCVTLACILAQAVGVFVDSMRGIELSGFLFRATLESLVTSVAVVAVSAAAGVLIGVMARSVLVAILLILFIGKNLSLIPLIPSWLGLPDYLWLTTLLTLGIAFGLMWLSAWLFARREF